MTASERIREAREALRPNPVPIIHTERHDSCVECGNTEADLFHDDRDGRAKCLECFPETL